MKVVVIHFDSRISDHYKISMIEPIPGLLILPKALTTIAAADSWKGESMEGRQRMNSLGKETVRFTATTIKVIR